MRHINYSPGYWGVYFVYCMIPISAYVWYLYRRVKEVPPCRFSISFNPVRAPLRFKKLPIARNVASCARLLVGIVYDQNIGLL
jgi:hypothetical protein